jgi:ATP-dependent DNA ligase
MRLRLVRQPFDHSDYIFELKHDGFRAIAYLQNGESKLVSRNQQNLGFEALKRSLLYAQHIEQHGKGFFAQICTRDIEGIVAKRKTRHLQGRRTRLALLCG